MQFQTAEVQQLAGLKPVDGVFKLQEALQEIESRLANLTASSPAYNEYRSLQQLYTNYLTEAKQLRQKGMASFRKYLAMKNSANSNTASNEEAATEHTQRNNVTHQAPIHPAPRQPQPPPDHKATAAAPASMAASTATRVTESDSKQNSREQDNDDDAEMMQLMEQNSKLRQQVEALIKSKSEYEETEHELRLVLEEYKFTQLSHKQEINNLKNSIATYKKASDSKTKSLDTLCNEYETAKNNNSMLSKQNAQLKQRITQYINENTNLKEELIEKRAECDQLIKDKLELQQKLQLSQRLNSAQPASSHHEHQQKPPTQQHDHHEHGDEHADIEHIADPVVPKQEELSTTHRDHHHHADESGLAHIEQRLQRVYNMVKSADNNHEMKHELEIIMEQLHPINIASTAPSAQQQQQQNEQSAASTAETVRRPMASSNEMERDEAGNYMITEEEYRDIEKVIDDRDKYMNKMLYYENNLQSLSEKYNELKTRFGQTNEEKALMMNTLKTSVERLATENSALREKMSSLSEERSAIKENELKTQNNFYQIYEENKERKFEMNDMQQKLKALNEDIETYKYLAKQLKENNSKLSENLKDALERIDKLCQDKECIAKKLREANKLTQELLRERNKQLMTSDDSEKKGNQKEKQEEVAESKEETVDFEAKYEGLLREKMEIQAMCDENDGTVNELTNQVIELETKVRELELENELLRKQMTQITHDNERKTHQIRSAQRVALSLISSNREHELDLDAMKHGGGDATSNRNHSKDMFGLQPPPQPDLITSLLTYLLPFLFEDDDQPKIV
mmetsp:Transcript_20804/g.33165  ORF Transcript_20804/g.33165 Transcript_20804/m.33165 type:complete len:800 (+) Transcript_20804:35-2434(+)